MKVAGIIAEYNPFHNGHALLFEKARLGGATHIVAVMSGNYVQRGEPALFSHGVRTRAALECGADLILQLPCIYAVSGAQRFAEAGVRILDSLDCIDELIFGSECGDINKIISAADAVYGEKIKDALKAELEKGLTFASARENALRSIDADAADIIRHPNNILGVEYAAAIRRQGSGMIPVTFARDGAAHDEEGAESDIASASYIRKLIKDGGVWQRYVPEAAMKIFAQAIENGETADISRIENAVLYRMRTVGREVLGNAPDVSEGIENRIYDAAKKAVSLEELYMLAKTKRYSHARIRRIVINSFLGITAGDASIPVPYIRVTGFNSKGAEILRAVKGKTKLPLITKAADVSALGNEAKRIFETECSAGDVYSLCLSSVLPCGKEKEYIPVNAK